MREKIRVSRQDGFSLIELLVSITILGILMGSIVGLFSTAVSQYNSETSNSVMNQDARSAFDLMSLEIGQAGSHREIPAPGAADVTLSSAITANAAAQAVNVSNGSGIQQGDYVDFGVGNNNEVVQLSAVSGNSLTGIFRVAHAAGVPVRLFAQPYINGIITPAGLGANSSATTNVLKFFGDINADGKVYYVEYRYDAASASVTRSMTPVSQGAMNAATTLIQNVKAGSVQFTHYTGINSEVISVDVAFTVTSTTKTGSTYMETPMFSKISSPSVTAASNLQLEIQQYGGPTRLPPTPPKVLTWSAY